MFIFNPISSDAQVFKFVLLQLLLRQDKRRTLSNYLAKDLRRLFFENSLFNIFAKAPS